MRPLRLINTPHIEIWPASLLRVRSNRDARVLARAGHVLRRKRDGRYLAADVDGELMPLIAGFRHEAGVATAVRAVRDAAALRRPGLDRIGTLPLARLQERLDVLGLDDAYGERTGLALVAEPDWLALAGLDRYRRALWLHPGAARAWTRMRDAALRDGIVLEAISGYRSHDYQLGIFERKRAHGQRVADILVVNAAPGYSEHHSGRALDISTAGEPAAEASFESTAAFAWLAAHAHDHGFAMSYPRENPHGIAYEPWHWCWHPTIA